MVLRYMFIVWGIYLCLRINLDDGLFYWRGEIIFKCLGMVEK